MGFAYQYINTALELNLFGDGRINVLDIGSSNLYGADAASVCAFVRRFNPRSEFSIDEFAAKIERGSGYDSIRGGLNEAFLGELLVAAGMGYDAIDIADGYKTTLLDLNVDQLPDKMVNSYDVVFNFGTTEHIINQQNSFKAIHDAANVGAYMWHQVPAGGYLDHGYFIYTGKFFVDLAKYNSYEIFDMWFDGPAGPENQYAAMRTAKDAFPAIGRRLSQIGTAARETAIDALQIPTLGINVIFRKLGGGPFRGAVETSTSVGAISETVTKRYAAPE